MLVPLAAIATTALPLATAVVLCSKDRQTVHANKNESKGGSSKSHKSKRSGNSTKSGHGKGKREGKSASKHGKSEKSHKSGRSKSEKSHKSGSKSQRSSSKSKKSKKSSKKPKASKLASDAEKKLEKSGKSGKSNSRKRREEANKAAASIASDLQAKNKSLWDPQPEGAVCKSKVACDNSTKESQKASNHVKSLVEEVNEIKHSQSMVVKPSSLQYQSLGGLGTLEIKNKSNYRKAYKLKCSDNALYRVNNVYGFAEPNSTVKIDVLRYNGETKMDKLVILTATAASSENDPHHVFDHNVEREMMVVPLQVV